MHQSEEFVDYLVHILVISYQIQRRNTRKTKLHLQSPA